jgi:hypothetical protein
MAAGTMIEPRFSDFNSGSMVKIRFRFNRVFF